MISNMISDRILTHTATYYKYKDTDRNGKKTFDILYLSSVRFTLVLGKGSRTEGTNTNDKVVLYVDGVNSKITKQNGTEVAFENFAPTTSDKLFFHGRELFVYEVSPAFDSAGIHHYEIGLK